MHAIGKRMTNKNSIISISRWSIYLVLILVNISYCPGIILTPNYKNIVLIVIFLVGLNIGLNIKSCFNFAFKPLFFYALAALLYCSIIYLIFGIFLFQNTNNIFLAFICFLLGYSTPIRNKEFIYGCMKVFSVAALFLGLYSIFTNLGSFVISEQYAFQVKNSSGVLLESAIISCAFIINQTDNRAKFLWIGIMVLLFVCLLTFRCRTGIIAVICALTYFLYKSEILSKVIRNPFWGIFPLIIVALILTETIQFDYLYDSLFANKDVNSIDDITSGRLSTYEQGLRVFYENELLGNSILNYNLPPIDNFVISNLVYYGLLGSLLVIPIYIYIWYITVIGMIKNKGESLLPFLIMFILCITSFTEGPYPFGPGTPVIFGWFILGWYYENREVYSNN